MHMLAESYYAGSNGADQNFARAADWYLRLAKTGDARAQTSLGLMYARGYGVPKNIAEAHRWWNFAAIQNDPGAQYNLGLTYVRGEGVAVDYERAARWFRETVRLKMQQSGFACGIDPDRIAAAAEQYGRLQCNHPLRSEQELRMLLEQAGLAIEFITPSARKVNNAAGIRAPTVPSGGAFLQVVAKRQ